MEILSSNDNWKYFQYITIAAYEHLSIGFLKYLSSQHPAISEKSSQLFTRSLSYFQQQQKAREYVLLC